MAAASMTDVPPNFITIMGKPGVSKVQSARFREVEIKRNGKSKSKCNDKPEVLRFAQDDTLSTKATTRANAKTTTRANAKGNNKSKCKRQLQEQMQGQIELPIVVVCLPTHAKRRHMWATR